MSDLAVPRSAGITHPANLLTIMRLLFAPLLFWLVLSAEDTRGVSWAAFGLGVALASTDFFDGKVARRANVVSRSGAFLDPLADKVVILGSGFCLVAVDRYWWLPVTLMAVRELGITAWRSRWARHGLALPARRSAKYKTFVQGLALAMAVMPTLQDQDTLIDVMLWIAVVWTLVSGIQYLIDGQNALSSTGD
ncbi:MAG: CDP-diacylglycerol--glycerol-3-phosphate 3-phosphatidyltransferase [Acidimicrobiaceae bacterium]|nr:CDP-alcohol phosphatidyltransferase family protein [Acidimicrobiaceae bacterium]MXW62446.1 CDP-diacylglycerol--glycerol-3-phosphate 3-phosphatidyltransferase [Acidimicrobiaceae bacterium]MXW77370.1 CDP-diacylglycerol--glycerol-3-phosphate 3-phosphatidyltransferase [Acidimicrobiaceae bacterium]MYA75500.1 CDP-diacylglycerol--glycerol-3-phosphate 3-phosphatidyltransferase [Acidimicrobiaceae bacterium]MYC41418.1 CDP-diacylglycerol--glycerol-3-phosphate 3-phosphatidyltransferase [Acidimicrobiacea